MLAGHEDTSRADTKHSRGILEARFPILQHRRHIAIRVRDGGEAGDTVQEVCEAIINAGNGHHGAEGSTDAGYQYVLESTSGCAVTWEGEARRVG